MPDRLLPDRLAITFLTDRDGNIVSLSAPLEPMVKDIVFARLASGDCTDAAFRARCVGVFKGGATTHQVTLDSDGNLVLKPDNQPAYRLAPRQGRQFRIVELEGFVVEFRGDGTRSSMRSSSTSRTARSSQAGGGIGTALLLSRAGEEARPSLRGARNLLFFAQRTKGRARSPRNQEDDQRAGDDADRNHRLTRYCARIF